MNWQAINWTGNGLAGRKGVGAYGSSARIHCTESRYVATGGINGLDSALLRTSFANYHS